MREAVRILEGRGVARVRRGPQGGLVVGAPSEAHLVKMVSGFAYLTGVTVPEITEAWVAVHVSAIRYVGARVKEGYRWGPVVQPHSEAAASDTDVLRRFAAEVIERSGNRASELFSVILTSLLPEVAAGGPACTGLELLRRRIIDDLNDGRIEDAARRGRELFGHIAPASARTHESDTGPRLPDSDAMHQISTPAFELVRRFMAATAPDDWVAGQPLGNEFAIAESLRVDRSVVRQAIRIMEAAETAVTLPGRGRGLTTRRPTSAPLSRLICVYLASCHEPIADVAAAAAGLMSEATHLAAQKATTHEVVVLHRLLDDLPELSGSLPLSALQPVERLQHRLADNALLSLFLDGAHAYTSWSGTEQRLLQSWAVEQYVQSTQEVLEAIVAGDGHQASRLEAVKQDRLMRCRSASRPGGGRNA
jgi:DNA-binding FadR family transcriptional regulator